MKKLLSLVLMFLVYAAMSQETDRPCKPDIEKFCKDVKGKKEILQCLKKNEANLSAECKARGAEKKSELKAKFQELKDKCSEDKIKFCKDVKLGKGAFLKCLKDNEAQLSAECKATLPIKK